MGGVYSSTAATAAFLSTAFISLAPNVIFLFLPRDQTHPAPKTTTTTTTAAWLTLGQALAAGGLLGDVFLHTLAHATSDEATGVWILLGFCFFLTTDLGIRALEGRHHHKDNDDDDDEDRAHHNNNNNTATVQRPTIVLNLVADAMHNFTDGLAIGASYASSATAVAAATATAAPTVWSLLSRRGGWATLSILCHEVPHELGDVCTLVRAGYTTRQAMLAQLGTALAAFLGTAVALAVSSSSSSGGGDHHGKGDDEWAQDRLVWVTAGGFVYLGATTILPEVLEQRQGGTVRFRLAQWMAFMTGILCLYAVAVLEEGGHDHHHHHHNDHGTTHGHSHGHGHHHHHHHSHATATDEL